MKDFNSQDRDRRRLERRERQAERVGGRYCLVCGEDNPCCLEEHHLAGRANDPHTTVTLCRNCHAKVTDPQQDRPPDLLSHKAQTSSERRRINMLYGQADLFRRVAEEQERLADELYAARNGER